MATASSEEIVERLVQTRKYRHICKDTLERIARWSVDRYETSGQALKASKRKLHQVHGAYFDRVDFDKINDAVATLPAIPAEDLLRSTCSGILESHQSTAERMGFLAEFYPPIFDIVGQPTSILDLACGLNPFALPWMTLQQDVRYRAFDIDVRLIDTINGFFARLDRPPPAECLDVLGLLPDMDADLVLLLKSVPCLEQQEKGACERLLRELRYRYAAVSFPVETLSGRRKGMRGYYERFLNGVIGQLGLTAETLDFPTETVYVVRRDD